MSWEKAIRLVGIGFVAGLVAGAVNGTLKPHPVVALAVHGGAQLAAFRYFG